MYLGTGKQMVVQRPPMMQVQLVLGQKTLLTKQTRHLDLALYLILELEVQAQ